MDKVIVSISAILLVWFIIWWFFGKHQSDSASSNLFDDSQEIAITVSGGYSPNRITLKKGIPARIIFNRIDASNCFSHVVFVDFGINQELPINQKITINIDTAKEGEFDFACGMNMFHGKVIIK